ncbi:MAG: trypsin-like serine protease [Ruminococcaceae bacterium]|nr:trypsin-like serine protease [Oscillospiraceae bacterium]
MNDEFTTPINPSPDKEETEQENTAAHQENFSEEEVVFDGEVAEKESSSENNTDVQSEPDETPVIEAEKVSEPIPQQSYVNTQYHYAPNSNYNTNPQQQTYYYPSQNQQPVPQQTPKKNRKGLKVFAACIAIALVFALGFGVASISKSNGNKTSNSNNFEKYEDGPELNINESPVSPTAASVDGALTTSQIAAKVKPSIVGIVVYAQNNRNSTAGEGTGVIMGEDDSGEYTYIITCAHVISDRGISVRVQTEDGTAYDAEIVGLDTRTDLGVVKIKAKGLPAAEFGNSDSLRVGDSVYAIGNPGGIEFFGSFTGGFISAIDRPVSSEIGYTMKCIQHDAAINPGNSGGALVNVFGQVIGINSQKIAATDYEGMGFAIPITSAKEIIENLIAYSYVPNRPKLGITYYPVSASAQYSMIAQIKGLPAGTLIINDISADSSLANTNIRQYDMIVAVDGKPLTTADVLLEKIDNGKVGDKMTLSICRVNADYSIEEFDVEITLVEDKGDSTPATTTVYYIDPFEYFNNQFGY